MQVIAARSVSKHITNDKNCTPILHDISFAVSTGEICALTGPSGSGKTTLMNILGLLDRPTTGDLEINGVSTRLLSSNALADLRSRTIGFVFQSFHLLPRLSALENVALPLTYRGMDTGERRSRARALLERVGLAERINYQPHQLSGGQRQRVAIARALVGEPSLVLADEPTGNLDSSAADDVMALFRELNSQIGLTIIIVTHDPTIAARCPRRIIMHDGRLMDDEGRALRSVDRP